MMNFLPRNPWFNGGALAVGGYLAYRALYPRRASFQDQVVVITGGSKGLGMILAREFGKKGAKIAIVARRSEELERAQAWLQSQGIGEVLSLSCDVAQEDQVKTMVERVIAHYGKIDVLVNNAGTIAVAPLESLQVEDFKQAHDVMFWGQLYPSLAVLPFMQQQGRGHLVNITSIGGMISVPHLLPYCSAKFAAVGLSQGLHSEMQRYGIKVTTIVPGLMRTGSYINATFKGKKQREYTWFSTAASLPGLSLSAERAAEQILDATARGEAVRILGMPAKIGVTLTHLFPNFSSSALTLVNRLLPAPHASMGWTAGKDLKQSTLFTSGRSRAAVETYQMPSRENHPESQSAPAL